MEEQHVVSSNVMQVPEVHEQRKLKVLVVEDDSTQWPLWETILNALEAELDADWVKSAEDAQKLLRQSYQSGSRYDLVISDVFLEGVSTGVDLWNRYGEMAQNFVFVSGVPQAKGTVLEGLQFGEPLFLEKPINIKECRRVLRTMIGAPIERGNV